jgi:hypothetical protein
VEQPSTGLVFCGLFKKYLSSASRLKTVLLSDAEGGEDQV